MSPRIIRTFPDGEKLSAAAASEFVHCARNSLTKRGRFTVALSGGSTPKKLYHLLTTEPFRGQVDWQRVEVFWGDERCVPPNHPDSNYRMACEAMLESLPIPSERIHRMEAERADLEAAAFDYQKALERVFFDASSGQQPPAFDLMLLGMGANAHTASLFPHTDALKEKVRWVVPNRVPELNTTRMTMTYPILNRSREVLFLVAGADKAEPLAEVLTGPTDSSRLPSQAIQPESGQLSWFVEADAASRLPSSLVDKKMQG